MDEQFQKQLFSQFFQQMEQIPHIAAGIQRLEGNVDSIRHDLATATGAIGKINDELHDHTLDDARIQSAIDTRLTTIQQQQDKHIPRTALTISTIGMVLSFLTAATSILLQLFIKKGG